MTDEHAKTVAEVEQELHRAMAADIEQTYGDTVVVVRYMFVAEVLDADGDVDTRWSASSQNTASGILGWCDFVATIVRDKIIRRRQEGE